MEPKELIQVLRNDPLSFHWRGHGIGFIKAYTNPDKTERINIYDKRFIVPNITLHHDHPWHLTSRILAGELTNTRYQRLSTAHIEHDSTYETFHEGVINCANFRGIEAAPRMATLVAQKPEIYRPNDTYMQFADEIHATEAIDGTVTLLRRMTPLNGNGTARVFWPLGTEYVDATIHELSTDDVHAAINKALELLEEEYAA